MVIRRNKKRKKYLGNRTRGAGDTKNRRGAGSKGGKGKTGKWRHKKSRYYKEIAVNVIQKSHIVENPINLFDINNYINGLIISGKATNDIILDFKENKDLKKYTKVVGKGYIKYKVHLKNIKCSKSVAEKVKEKGGSCE